MNLESLYINMKLFYNFSILNIETLQICGILTDSEKKFSIRNINIPNIAKTIQNCIENMKNFGE